MALKLKINKMHFKSVNQWAHAFYNTFLYTFTMLNDGTSLLPIISTF